MSDGAAKALQSVFDEARRDCRFCGSLPSDGPICGAVSPGDGVRCTREPGHGGVHAACGVLAHPHEVWGGDEEVWVPDVGSGECC